MTIASLAWILLGLIALALFLYAVNILIDKVVGSYTQDKTWVLLVKIVVLLLVIAIAASMFSTGAIRFAGP